MGLKTDAEHPAVKTATPSAKSLYRRRESILNEWVEKVQRHVRTADKLESPIIVNTLPLFLERLAEALCEECTRETATESSNFAQEHGSERARVTNFGPDEIIEEYKLLRKTIIDQIKQDTKLTERDYEVIQKSFDKAVQDSMTAYFLVHSRLREQFVATMTHDLRNPLGAIRLSADLIRRTLKSKNPEDVVEMVEDLAGRILNSAKRADRMIQDMLDASVIQFGEKMSMTLSECNIQDIVRDAIGDRTEADHARIRFIGKDVRGHWDADAFQRSVENLIGNAFKYGDEKAPITVKIESLHDRVMVSVHNEGNPIPAEHFESLFQAFRRAESAKTSGKKGWGIGLALARSTAERMGGSLGVDSSNERGTTFTIDVPCDARPFIGAPTSTGHQ